MSTEPKNIERKKQTENTAIEHGKTLPSMDPTPSNFQPDIKTVAELGRPSHFILSGYLRKSKTFEIYSKAMPHFGIQGNYLPYELPKTEKGIDTEKLRTFLTAFRCNPFLCSIVVSDPYKQAVTDLLDEVSADAKTIGGVNLIIKVGKRLVGDNKDGEAFIKGVQSEIDFKFEGASMLFFGCGGVSSAIALKLAPRLKKIGLVDVDEKRRGAVAKMIKTLYPYLPVVTFDRKQGTNFSNFDVYYNGTGLGKFGTDPQAIHRTPLLKDDIFSQAGLAIDANYTPEETVFLKFFAAKGSRTLNGFSHMLSSTMFHLSLISGKKIDYFELKSLVEPSTSPKIKSRL